MPSLWNGNVQVTLADMNCYDISLVPDFENVYSIHKSQHMFGLQSDGGTKCKF